MPIPDENTPWLPAPWDHAYKSFAENDPWYTRDTDALAKMYQRAGATRATHVRNGQQMQGGLVGAAQRMFWGRPVPADENRVRLHVPTARTSTRQLLCGILL